jgi:hypothetical protein
VTVFSSQRAAFRGEVTVFTSRANLPAGYVEIGQVVVRDQGDDLTISEQDLLNALKAGAASIGANAVLLSRESRSSSGSIIGNTVVIGSERVLIGIALWLQ